MKLTVFLFLLLTLASLAFAQVPDPDLSGVIGRTVYVCQDGPLYTYISKQSDNGPRIDWGTPIENTSFGGFWPATIENIQAASFSYGSYTVAVLLKLKNGRLAVTTFNLPKEDRNLRGDELLKAFVGPGLTVRSALPNGVSWLSLPTVGMNADDAECLKGRPKVVNSNSTGDEQWVYDNTYLYVDRKRNVIRHIQKFGQ